MCILESFIIDNMILILSIHGDHSTDEVMDWIKVLGGQCLRLNDSDIIESHSFSIDFTGKKTVGTIAFKSKKINLKDIKAVWFRKFGFYDQTKYGKALKSQQKYIDINQFLSSEFHTFLNCLKVVLSDKKWLLKPDNNYSKHQQLITANRVGLKIPPTIITNDKSYLIDFKKKKKQIISKPIKEVSYFKLNGQGYSPYTDLLNDETIETLDNKFFPSLVQGYIDKKFEIRSFFLNKKLYSMAMFTQNQENSKIDFRRYNTEKPERYVPYILPAIIKKKVLKLMKELDLNTGSIDLIKDKKGDYYFLEVNPGGQFSMVSKPCNYPLEKEIAKYLINQNL